ncbi:DUF58 domain-containing protein [Micromonosporaceae bacterium DT194]|uniref:DUF58 domain-containing protein n=1 Tax=Melissospora conviva TaxID=3388432 RepID=UPI003C1A2D26
MTVTSRGVALLAAAVLLLTAGFRFAYPELAVLGAAAAVAVAGALLHAAGQPRLTVTRSADPDRVARGEPATMTLTLGNRARLRPVNLLAEDSCGNRAVPVPVLRLRPGHDTTVSYPVPTHRRGVIPVGPLRVTRHDALGLVSVTRRYGQSAPVWVYPRVHPLRAVPTGVARSLDGRVDGVPHGSITFDSLREYVVGDEMRRVHWRTSARIGELMVREHVDTSLPRLVVLLDNRAAAHPAARGGIAETFEAACEAAASVVTAALHEELPVTLLEVVAGGTELPSPLDRLAATELTRAPGDGMLREVLGRLRRDRLGDTLVFLTGPGGAADLGDVAALRPSAYPSLLVGLFGAAGVSAGGAAGLTVLEAADGAEFAAEWDGVRRW